MSKKKMKKPAPEPERYVWLIAYINQEHISIVDYQLSKHADFLDIDPFIPIVRILRKQLKSKDHFEDVPLLFNYGFFKVPINKACNPEFLARLKNEISTIVGWVKDSSRLKNNGIRAAIASEEEIAALVEYAKSNSIYSSEDMSNLKQGDFINLIGYPWEGMQAEVVSVNHKKREADVALCIEAELTKTVRVSFDNIFYTIYHGGWDENKTTEKVFDKPLRTGADKSNTDE